MSMLCVTRTKLSGVLILEPRRFVDDRGFFCEVWNRQRLQEAGIEADFVQDNQSISKVSGTVRGLHFQVPPHAQDKLVRCGRGCVLDVAVDIRRGSPTFGHWVGVELSAENGRQLFVPKGFAHGFVTREPYTELLYKCSDYYSPQCDGGIRFDDPDLGIDWGVTAEEATLSDKDRAAPFLRDITPPFSWDSQI